MTAAKQVILVNEADEMVGSMEKMEAHRKAILHRAFSVFIFNARAGALAGQAGSLSYVERRGKIGEKIWRHAHVGVADQNQIVFCKFFELGERGNFCVRAEVFGANDKLRVAIGIFLEKFLDNFAGGIIFVRDAEKDLRLAGIVLIEPAFERGGGRCPMLHQSD